MGIDLIFLSFSECVVQTELTFTPISTVQIFRGRNYCLLTQQVATEMCMVCEGPEFSGEEISLCFLKLSYELFTPIS